MNPSRCGSSGGLGPVSPWARAVAIVLALTITLASCSGPVPGHGRPAAAASVSPSVGPSTPGPSGSPGRRPCPAGYAEPDPNRPRVTFTFDVAAAHDRLSGTEQVDFTPDADITEMVFRLTANTAPSFAAGTRIDVTSATADHGGGTATYTRARAAAGSQGGLLHIPFAAAVPAGTTIRARLAFTLRIGPGQFDRFGRSGDFLWFGSAQPLLAWERGYGWHDEPMLAFTAESASSEAAQTDVTVTAPVADTVLMSGRPLTATEAGTGRASWHASVAAARDVSVAAGPFAVRDFRVGPVDVRVGAPTEGELAGVVSDETFAIAGLVAQFGPFPFPNLSVALLPASGGGIEYPSSFLLFGSQRLVTVHETAHQWFYAMVGNSQAEHAWLDEAFATYAEQLLDHDPTPPAELTRPGPVDRPTADYANAAADYYRITYFKGAAALEAARQAAGADAFDAAIRCYVNAQAWSVADPGDLAAALADLPAALAVLRSAGAVT